MDKDGTLLYSFSFFPLHRNQTLERTECASIYIFMKHGARKSADELIRQVSYRHSYFFLLRGFVH